MFEAVIDDRATAPARAARASRVILGAVCALGMAGGCGIGQSGISPPLDRVFFPAGIAIDPLGQWLYVVNSNSDLRYNAGTVVAVSLAPAREDRSQAAASIPRCPRNRFVPAPGDPRRFCCRDFIDERIVNCDERGYIDPDTTVQIGSFGGSIILQPFERDGELVRRLFVAVRAEPSLTFIDTTIRDGRAILRCTGDRLDQARPAPGGSCAENWRIRAGVGTGGIVDASGGVVNGVGGAVRTVGDISFQEEPHALALDESLGILYVGHLGGIERNAAVVRGVSVVDVCAPQRAESPRLASILTEALPRSGSLGVSYLAIAAPGNPEVPIYATAELTADVGELALRNPTGALCNPTTAGTARDLTLVPGRRFLSSAFGTRGADLRGLLFSPDRTRAYLLHRQYTDRRIPEFNPPAVVVIDRTPNSRGEPLNAPVGLVDVCTGPNRMLSHDAGRGTRLFVNCFEGGEIYVIDPSLMAVEAVIEIGAGPADLVFPQTDRTLAYVAGFADNNVSVIDLTPGAPTEYRVVQRIGFPRTSAVSR